LRQHRWLELIKDYDLEVHYHPEKANVVVNALSTKSYANRIQASPMSKDLCEEFDRLNLSFATYAMELEVAPTLEQEIHKGQLEDEKLNEIADKLVIAKSLGFCMDENRTLWYGKRIYVPKLKTIRDAIL